MLFFSIFPFFIVGDSTAIIAGVVAGVFGLIAITAGGFIFLLYRRKKSATEKKGNGNIEIPTKIREEKPNDSIPPNINVNHRNNEDNDKKKDSNTDTIPNNPHPPPQNDTNPSNMDQNKNIKKQKNISSTPSTSKTKLRKDKMSIPPNTIQIKQQIGQGNFATVYYGEWQATPVALKVIR